MSIEKPTYTNPCNNCGKCCSESLCVVAEMAGATTTPCEFLTTESDGRRLCGIVLSDDKGTVKKTLGIGTGCSMADLKTTDQEITAFNIRSHIKVFGSEPVEGLYS